MSVANAGTAAGATSVQAEDPARGSISGPRRGSVHDVETTFNVPSDADGDNPIAPDQFNPKFESSQKEIYSYYTYYIGNNGLTLFNFGPCVEISELPVSFMLIQTVVHSSKISSISKPAMQVLSSSLAPIAASTPSYSSPTVSRLRSKSFSFSRSAPWQTTVPGVPTS